VTPLGFRDLVEGLAVTRGAMAVQWRMKVQAGWLEVGGALYPSIVIRATVPDRDTREPREICYEASCPFFVPVVLDVQEKAVRRWVFQQLEDFVVHELY